MTENVHVRYDSGDLGGGARTWWGGVIFQWGEYGLVTGRVGRYAIVFCMVYYQWYSAGARA